jgi:hypothetical protein
MKEWRATHRDCQIRGTNTWHGGARLYLDDWRDANNTFVSYQSPALSVRVTPAKSEPFLVEVYVKMRLTVKARICVDGKQVGGDTF